MPKNSKFEKLTLNPLYSEQNETSSPAKNKYSFKRAEKKSGRERVYTVGFIPVYVMLIISFVIAAANVFLSKAGIYESLNGIYPYIARCVSYAVIYLVPALIYTLFYKKDRRLLGFSCFSLSYMPFIFFALILLIFCIAAEKFSLAYLFSVSENAVPVNLFYDNYPVLAILSYAIIPAVCEEILFRGVLQKEISQTAGGLSAIIVSAFSFALFHLDLPYFPVYFTSGILLAICMHVCSSVIPCIIIHALNNLFSLLFSGNLTFIATERVGNALIMILLIMITLLIMLFYLRSIEKICTKKALSVELVKLMDEAYKTENSSDATSAGGIKFYSKPYRLFSDTGYTLHKFLRVIFSPALIILTIIFLFIAA